MNDGHGGFKGSCVSYGVDSLVREIVSLDHDRDGDLDLLEAAARAPSYKNSQPWEVVGVTPSGSTACPSRALTKALLPALNSPTMTSMKSSSS